MSTILVVDDSAMERDLAGRLLKSLGDAHVVYAADGAEALAAIPAAEPDLVVTDLQMPGMGGLELTTKLRASHPEIPVVLTTAFGSEETAAEALRRGAASYVPKCNLARDLSSTVARTLELWRAVDDKEQVRPFLVETSRRFVLENDPALVAPLVAALADEVRRHWGTCSGDAMLLSVALHEAVSNALHHGNLEVDSALREEGMDRYLAAIDERRGTPPWRDRRIHVASRLTHDVAEYVVRDEGSGFDHSNLPDPTDAANLVKASGRGLMLIQTFMDEVVLNDVGNEIRMIKRRP